MSTNYQDCDYYELDMRHRVCDLEFERACFLARPSVMLGLVPIQDGNAFIALYGKDLQSGIAGCGDTPDLAMLDFDKQWHKKAEVK